MMLESLQALIAAQRLDAEVLSTLPSLAAGEAPLFLVDEWTAFAPLSADDMPANGSGANLEHAANMLDRFDALLSQVESALGVALEAKALVQPSEAIAQDAMAIRISDGENCLGLLLSASHPKAASWERAATLLPPDLSRLLVPVELNAIVARLPIGELSQLENGDCVLLPSSMQADIAPRHGGQSGDIPTIIDGRYLPATGQFSRAETVDAEVGEAAFNAPLKMTLPMGKLPALMLVAESGAIALPPLGTGMPVTLSVGGKPLAAGGIVELAGQLAVLIGEPAAVTDDDGMPEEIADDLTAEGE